MTHLYPIDYRSADLSPQELKEHKRTQMEDMFYTWIANLFFGDQKFHWRGSASTDWIAQAKLSLVETGLQVPLSHNSKNIESLLQLCSKYENLTDFAVFNSMKFNMDLALRCNQ